MIPKTEFVLLIGATGQTGFHVANFLVERRMPVRLLVRKKERVTELFGVKEVAFQSIVECSDFTSEKNKQEVKKAFEPSSVYGPITRVISAMGASTTSKQSTQKVEFDAQKTLIDFSKEFEVKKYVLISAALITKAWHPISLLLNIFMSNVFAYKANAQNYLRESGLNYVIVRPGGLKDSYEEKPPTGYTVGQGDNGGSGFITRPTAAMLAVDSLLNDSMNNKVTFECFSARHQLDQPYQPSGAVLDALRADTEADIVRAKHSRASSTVKFVVMGSLAFGIAKLVTYLNNKQ